MRTTMGILMSVCLSATSALAANVDGQVNGPDGKPYMGAFVVAENAKNRMTYSVLSNDQGRYHINNLPAGTYNVQISTIGVKADPNRNVELKADQKASFDFALQTAPVRWSELTTYQGRKLLPKTAQHDLSHRDPFFSSCWQSCHSFQKRIASAVRDEEGWKEKVLYMRDVVMAGEGPRLPDATVDDFAAQLAKMFGPESPKPAFASDAPEYKALVRPVNPKALNIAYVEYDFPATLGQGPWSAVEDKDGMMWIPYYGRGNSVVRLDPETSEFKKFALPFAKTAGVHSAVPAPDGKVWFTEAAMGKIASLDPKSNEIEEFPIPPLPNGKRNGAHTVRVDERGLVWVSGGPAISMFDPKTRKFENYDLGNTYGNVSGRNGDQWFTSFRLDGPIGRVMNGTLTTWDPPTKGKPQRIDVDDDGFVYFS